jgi:hypothetical protein
MVKNLLDYVENSAASASVKVLAQIDWQLNFSNMLYCCIKEHKNLSKPIGNKN